MRTLSFDRAALYRACLSLAILSYLALSAMTLLPSSPARDWLFLPVYSLWRGLGFGQNYSVFSPNIPRDNTWMAAIVTLSDGTAAFYEFPRMERLGLWQRMVEERYRKWWQDHLMTDYYSFLLPDTARFIARRFTNAANPPAKVSIFSFNRPVRDFARADGAGVAPALRDMEPAGVSCHLLFAYDVHPEDLR